MKITDYALIFVGVTLPIILISYINIALTIRTYQQEMYYQKVIDGAVEDTLSEMKRVESDEITNEYGYSGTTDNKISINANIAVSTFFNSIYNSLNLYGDKGAQELVQLYVPVLAIIDYNGVYISSVEEIDGVAKHVLKPKRYFTFEYGFREGSNDKVYVLENNVWQEYDITATGKYEKKEGSTANTSDLYSVVNLELTMDDRVFCTVSKVNGSSVTYIESNEFYIEDDNNNALLWPLSTLPWQVYKTDNGMFSYDEKERQSALKELIQSRKESIMVEIITEELTYAANKNNEYAHKKGIAYNFAFTIETDDEMYNYIRNTGVLALVQGIKVGNKYLNYKAYNMSDLMISNMYYCTTGSSTDNYASSNLYHKYDTCSEYRTLKKIVYTREEAAMLGYYPCPVCNP